MAFGWKRVLAGGVLAFGMLGAACSNYGGTDGGTTTPAKTSAGTKTTAPTSEAPTTAKTTGESCADSAGTAAVVQQGFAFVPAKLTAKECTTVNISNKDTATHTFTIDGTPINVTLPGGSKNSAELALLPGDYVFYCRFHGSPEGTGMAGTLTVT